MKVYLSGTLKTAWREQIKEAHQDIEYFDPTTHGLEDPAKYTNWNLNHIQQCDVVFAYVSKTSSGIGVSAEIGFALGRGKKIILVDEKKSKSCIYIRSVSTVVGENLQEGSELLTEAKKWIK